MQLYVCLHMHIYNKNIVHICIYIYAYIYIYICIYLHVHVFVYIYIRKHILCRMGLCLVNRQKEKKEQTRSPSLDPFVFSFESVPSLNCYNALLYRCLIFVFICASRAMRTVTLCVGEICVCV